MYHNHYGLLLGLREIELKEEYRSDRDDIVAEFFFPCLSHCIEYDRCVDFLSIQTLATISMAFENFTEGKAKLRMITGHKFKTADLNLLTKLFSEKYTKSFEGKLIKDTKIQRLQNIVNNGQVELKIAIPNSEQVTNSFSERIGIFRDDEDQTVAFTGTSKESFSTQTRDFESVDVFTSWNDKSRVERKMKDFEELWQNKTKHVDVCDFMWAEENNLLKYSSEWITQN
jgi:HKD family nuclease